MIPRMSLLQLTACSLAFALSVLGWAENQPPAPVVELNLDDGLVNKGIAGGEAKVAVYAQGEDPLLLPGPWGDCLDLTAASRFGGTLEQMTPSGSALILSDAALSALTDFTLVLWFRATTAAPDVAARLLNKAGCWEILSGNGRPGFFAVKGEDKLSYSFPVTHVGQWTFLAVSVDQANRRISLYAGDKDSGLAEPNTVEMTLAPSASEGPLEIGNFALEAGGIRPFKGWMDNIRIYDVALSPGQVTQLFAGDLAAQGRGKKVFEYGRAPVEGRRFQPKKSDIFFSSRWQGREQKNALDLMRAFHVTHLLWVYGSKPEFIQQVHDLGISYEGTLNGECGTAKATRGASAEGDTTGRQHNLDGNKVIHTHMLKWKNPPLTGCQNSPDFRKLFWEEAEKLIQAGADSIMVDDWEMSAGTARSGLACFCPSCVSGFREYLRRSLSAEELKKLGVEDVSTFDYRAFLKTKLGIQDAAQYKAKFRELPLTPHFLSFQIEGLRDFYKAFRKHLDAVSPDKYIPLSVNLSFCWSLKEGGFLGGSYVDLMDFLDGEARKSMQAVSDYVPPCKTAEAFGIPQIMQTKPPMVGTAFAIGPPRAALATTYALGQWFLVPWDLYMDNDAAGQPAPRYYGTVAEWGAYYDFIHENLQLFDGYQAAAMVGVLVNADTASFDALRQVCRRLTELQVPFQVIVAAAKFDRAHLSADLLRSLRYLINLSPEESYGDEDRKAVAAARDSRRVRFLKPTDDIESVLQDSCLPLIRVEGPKGIYAFLRVKPGAAAAVIHVVNWNTLPDGTAADAFSNVTLALSAPEQWGKSPQIKYCRPGEKGGVDLQVEAHRDSLRVTLPRLETWGVLQIQAEGGSAAGKN